MTSGVDQRRRVRSRSAWARPARTGRAQPLLPVRRVIAVTPAGADTPSDSTQHQNNVVTTTVAQRLLTAGVQPPVNQHFRLAIPPGSAIRGQQDSTTVDGNNAILRLCGPLQKRVTVNGDSACTYSRYLRFPLWE